MRASGEVSTLRRRGGRAVRAVDERWQAAWRRVADPAPGARLARASKAVNAARGLAPIPDPRLQATVELQIARIHLARAQLLLQDRTRQRQGWLYSDIRRAVQQVDALTKRTAKGQR